MRRGGAHPRFFCEHCGQEVPRNARACPSCGRFFVNVRCPRCGFVGAEELFKDGCPVCGYSAPPLGGGTSRPWKGWWPFGRSDSFGSESPETLPWWVYGITAFLLVISVVLFLVTFF